MTFTFDFMCVEIIDCLSCVTELERTTKIAGFPYFSGAANPVKNFSLSKDFMAL